MPDRTRRLLALLCAVLVLGACARGYHGPAEGAVEKKTYYAAHVEHDSYTTFICASYSNGVCTVNIPIQNDYDTNIPDAWYLTIASCADDNQRDHCQRGSFEVTQQVYDSVSIGAAVAYATVHKGAK